MSGHVLTPLRMGTEGPEASPEAQQKNSSSHLAPSSLPGWLVQAPLSLLARSVLGSTR